MPQVTKKNFATYAKAANWMGKKQVISTVQVNIGLLCNQICRHCHVESSPKKLKENMDKTTMQRLMDVISQSPEVKTIDITGGAPELNPYFRELVKFARDRDLQVIDRCNLTVLFEEGQSDTIEFLADNQVKIVASLPCYLESNVDKQRGQGVFNKSIEALQKLNQAGYGHSDKQLLLDLVYNPQGPSLPPPKDSLEESYKKFLDEEFGIVFNQLITITNMPIKRFQWDLKKSKQLDKYENLLRENFNEKTLNSVMCNDLISVTWDGKLFDCDFNHALNIAQAHKDIWQISSFSQLRDSPIAVGNHCFGCTAGSGSSCGGSLV